MTFRTHFGHGFLSKNSDKDSKHTQLRRSSVQKDDWLYYCPRSSYIRFLLGIVNGSGNLLFRRHFLGTAWMIVFIGDMADYMINHETPAANDRHNGVIVNVIYFLKTQVSYWAAASATLAFSIGAKKILQSTTTTCNLLFALHSTLNISHSRSYKTIKKKTVYIFIVAAAAAVTRVIRTYGLIFATVPAGAKEHFLVWDFPAIFMHTVIQTFLFLGKLCIIPLSVYFSGCCLLFDECCQCMNHMIANLATEAHSETSGKFTQKLRTLMARETELISALADINDAFSTLALILIANCLLGLVSDAGEWFSLDPSTLWQLFGFFLDPIRTCVILLSVVVCAVKFQESGEEMTLAWQALATHRYKLPHEQRSHDEIELLRFILQRTTTRNHALTVGGFAHISRSFAITVVAGYAGFICFLIERVENVCRGEPIRDLLANRSLSLWLHNSTE